jgi:hypothetical protein
MVTSQHEAAHRIFQEAPSLVASAFRLLNVPLPDNSTVELVSPDLTEPKPLERRVDTVLRIDPPDGQGFLLAIEAQGRPTAGKQSTWAYYLAHLKEKYQRPALLLVVCQDRGTAKWATGPFELGLRDWPSLILFPLVLGPTNVPVITDPDEAARDLDFAAFAAMVHSRSRDPKPILEALATAGMRDTRDATLDYAHFVEANLGDTPAQKIWREMMAMRLRMPGSGTIVEESLAKGREEGRAEGRAEGLQEGRAEGRAEGQADMLLQYFESQNIPVSHQARARIRDCSNPGVLLQWMIRAPQVTNAEEIFTDNAG